MLAFHLFPRLPLELRQRIWELSMEPRWVPREKNDYCSCSPPAVLHACSESRAHLQRYYTKCFADLTEPLKHTWANFDIDSIFLDQYDLGNHHVEESLTQKLVVIGCDSEQFFYEHSYNVSRMKALQDLTIISMDCRGDGIWWEAWISLFDAFYFWGNPAHFYTRITGPSNSDIQEVNRDNIRKVERAMIKVRMAKDPDCTSSDYELLSDSDDDLSGVGLVK